MTFSYTVTNQGSNDAVGQWTDSLYLSPTTSFVYTDPLLATNVHQGGLAAGQSYTDQVTAPVPGVAPGTYYVILRTDVLNQIPESNLANNVSASLSRRLDRRAGLDPGHADRRHAGRGTVGLLQGGGDGRPDAAGQRSTARSGRAQRAYVSFGTMPSQPV